MRKKTFKRLISLHLLGSCPADEFGYLNDLNRPTIFIYMSEYERKSGGFEKSKLSFSRLFLFVSSFRLLVIKYQTHFLLSIKSTKERMFSLA